MDGCPSPDDWFALGEDPRLDRHLDACAECRGVAAMIARAGVLGASPVTADDRVGLVPELVPAGAQLGRFVVRGAIGAGAMGVVLEAYDPKLERTVALKVVRRLRDDAGWERARERVLAEAVAMARLSHPNVVAIHDLFEVDGERLIAMEHVAGPDLDAWLAGALGDTARTGPTDDAEITRPAGEPGRRKRLAVLVDVARGLAAAHDAGVVHRDVKPSNILVTAEGRARVTDFGLAALGGGGAGGAVGTPGFVAPEVLAGGAADARSDQYAFAITAWRVMFGAAARRRGAIARVLRRAKDPDPARRFATMHDVARALQRAGRARIVAACVAAALVVAGVATVTVLATRAAPATCETDLAIDEAWSPARREAWSAALHGVVGADASRLVVGVDRAWVAWQAAGVAACPQPSPGTVACLASQRRRLVAVLEHATTARDASKIDDTLAQLRNTDCLAAPPPQVPELPPAERAVHDQIVAEIDEVTALSWLGQYAPALAKLDALLRRVPASDAALRGELLYRRADALARTGDTAGSIPVLEEALAIAERAGNPVARVNTMILLLAAYEELGRADEAGALAKVAEAAALAVPRDPARDARLANVLAGIAYRAGAYADAERKYRELVAMQEKRFADKPGGADPELAGSLHNLGLAVHALGRTDEAGAIQRRSLAMFEATVGAAHPDAALPVSELAGLATEAGRLDEAAALYRRAIANWERSLGDRHPNLSEPVASLGRVESHLGHHDAALALYRRASALAAGLGAEHPLVAMTKFRLAEELDHRGQRAEAGPLIRESVAAWDASGIDMPEAHLARFLLAGYVWEAGRRAQARELATKAHAGLAKLAAPYTKPAAEVTRWLAEHPAP